jgi:CheY-like chemotaxis protein
VNRELLQDVPDRDFTISRTAITTAIDPHERMVGVRADGLVLIVDDHVDSATAFALLVNIEGYEVSVAHDGFEAIQLVERLSPALIFMDIEMPRLNGLEAVRRIRAEPWGRHITICAVTGRDDDVTVRECSAAGFDFYLVKPVAIEDILALLPRSANGRSGRRAPCCA